MRHHRPKNWKDKLDSIKEAFRWRCASCQTLCEHTPASPKLTIYHIDQNPKNCHKDNLLALCFQCKSHLQQEAFWYFHYNEQQPGFFPENNYLSLTRQLWFEGLQMPLFEADDDVMECQHSYPHTPSSCSKAHQLSLPLFETQLTFEFGVD